MIMDEKIAGYKLRAQTLTAQGDGSLASLVQELIDEIERLAGENSKLRKALVKSTQPLHTTDKLKNALME